MRCVDVIDDFVKGCTYDFLSKITIMQKGTPIILLSKIIKFHEKKATMIQIGDTTMIQNMKNVTGKSKFQIDLK